MAHIIKDKKVVQKRINRIVGQLNGIKTMMDEDADCYRVLQQMSAAKGALNSLVQKYLEEHITEHVVLESDDSKRQQAGKDLVALIRSYFK